MFTDGSGRYGYQGSEKDNESKGFGNEYTTEFRGLDVRLAKWYSIDPKLSAYERCAFYPCQNFLYE